MTETGGRNLFVLKALAVPALFVLSALAANPAAYADSIQCQSSLVSVETDDQELHQRICRTVEIAIPILAACHLELKKPVSISLSDKLQLADTACFGLYHHGQSQIELLNQDAFKTAYQDSEFSRTMPPGQYFDGIVVHELTHAAIDQSIEQVAPCGVDQEYVAYAMQIASLTTSAQNDFIANVGVSHPVSVEEMNQVVLGFSPSTFAAKVWLHFSEPENGCNFVRGILRGETTLRIDPW